MAFCAAVVAAFGISALPTRETAADSSLTTGSPLAQAAGMFRSGEQRPRAAVGRVCLGTESHHAAFLSRLEGGEALRGVGVHAFVGLHSQCSALAARQNHSLYVGPLATPVVGQRILVLPPSEQGELIERLPAHRTVTGDIFGRGYHGLAGVGIGCEVIEHPMFRGGLPPMPWLRG
jgi:hypothetical protein